MTINGTIITLKFPASSPLDLIISLHLSNVSSKRIFGKAACQNFQDGGAKTTITVKLEKKKLAPSFPLPAWQILFSVIVVAQDLSNCNK